MVCYKLTNYNTDLKRNKGVFWKWIKNSSVSIYLCFIYDSAS